MKVLGKRVLVEEIMIKKTSKIIRIDEKDPTTFKIDHKVLQIGKECETDLKVGDVPIFGEHTPMNTRKLIEGGKDKLIFNIIVHIEDIVGIDD